VNSADPNQLDAQRMEAIRQFTSGLSHEGRNALQQISACAEMLAMEVSQSSEAADLVAGILEAGNRLQRLFDDVRTYSMRISSERRTTDLRDAWQSAWKSLAAARPDQACRLVERELPDTMLVEAAPGLMEVVFFKVFENAADACGRQVAVVLDCRTGSGNGRANLTVIAGDNGPGLSAEAARRAFEPFFSSKTHGTGLGLPIVKRIVEAHGGRVRAGNAAQGGAEIEIELPRAE
jgi:signal transduction histidine kinase